MNFKGIITRNKSTLHYSGLIELELYGQKNYPLITIVSALSSLDSGTLQNSIYNDGIRLTRLLASNIGGKYKWFEFTMED